MILTNQELKRVLAERPYKDIIQAAQKEHKHLVMHNTGVGLDKFIERLDYYEKQKLADIRKKLANSCKDLMCRIHRPIDKVFSAMGGSTYYMLPKAKDKEFRTRLQSVEFGYSLRKWIENMLLPAYHYDPNGVIEVAVGDNEAYPIYKSIMSIHEYLPVGRELEYIIYCLDKKEYVDNKGNILKVIEDRYNTTQQFRVIDDAFDYIIEWDGKTVKYIGNKIPNYFGRVPAQIISDIYDPITGLFKSPDDCISELLDKYLRELSVLNVTVNRHGFPKEWAYIGACDTCLGTQVYSGQQCQSCGGTGKKSSRDVAETMGIPLPENGTPIITPDVAGYIEAPVESWKQQVESIKEIKKDITYTKWGTHEVEDASNETATGKFIDVQPVNDALAKYSDACEQNEKFITDLLGQFYYGQSYAGSTVNYGRRYMIEDSDVLMTSLTDLIAANAPDEVLRERYEDYIFARYKNDNVKLGIALKLMNVEPLPYLNLTASKGLLTPEEFNKKLYYNEWRGQVSNEELESKTEKELRLLLAEYVLTKPVNKPVNVSL